MLEAAANLPEKVVEFSSRMSAAKRAHNLNLFKTGEWPPSAHDRTWTACSQFIMGGGVGACLFTGVGYRLCASLWYRVWQVAYDADCREG